MSDMGKMWREEHEAYKIRRDHRLEDSMAQLESLTFNLNGSPDFNVMELTPYHFRITHPQKKGCLDIYPIHKKYHDVWGDQRGVYKNLAQFVRNFFATQLSRSM